MPGMQQMDGIVRNHTEYDPGHEQIDAVDRDSKQYHGARHEQQGQEIAQKSKQQYGKGSNEQEQDQRHLYQDCRKYDGLGFQQGILGLQYQREQTGNMHGQTPVCRLVPEALQVSHMSGI